jgi:hypothetical protein
MSALGHLRPKPQLVMPGNDVLCQKQTHAVQQGLGSCHPHLLLNPDRERKRKCRAFAHDRIYPNSSAMHLDDALGDSEPKARAALLAGNRIVGLLKLLEQLGLIGRGYPRTGVMDGNAGPGPGRPAARQSG